MADLNSITITGRLVRDPEIRTTTTGKDVCSVTIAVQKAFKPQNGEPDADFIRIQAWEQNAVYIGNYGSKGRKIGLTGRITQRKYTDRDGNERESIEIVANTVTFLDKPTDSDGEAPQGTSRNTRQPATSRSSAAPSANEYDPFADE